jgi:hypothetical protein
MFPDDVVRWFSVWYARQKFRKPPPAPVLSAILRQRALSPPPQSSVGTNNVFRRHSLPPLGANDHHTNDEFFPADHTEMAGSNPAAHGRRRQEQQKKKTSDQHEVDSWRQAQLTEAQTWLYRLVRANRGKINVICFLLSSRSAERTTLKVSAFVCSFCVASTGFADDIMHVLSVSYGTSGPLRLKRRQVRPVCVQRLIFFFFRFVSFEGLFLFFCIPLFVSVCVFGQDEARAFRIRWPRTLGLGGRLRSSRRPTFFSLFNSEFVFVAAAVAIFLVVSSTSSSQVLSTWRWCWNWEMWRWCWNWEREATRAGGCPRLVVVVVARGRAARVS